MAQYIAYIENDNNELLSTDNYINKCDSYIDVLSLALEYLEEDQEFYGWSDATIREMMRELLRDGHFDMRNGRSFYYCEWDGKEEPLEVARRNDKQFHTEGHPPPYDRETPTK